jgi:hypothetical protein
VSKKLDEFLAAPENILKNEKEMVKAKQRKEREKARAAQLKSKKSKKAPTVEDMLADIVRIADDKELNPWWEFRSMSARRYELYGLYDMSWISKQFGQFSHALEVAGLRDQQGTRLLKANRARESRREHAQRYMERYVHPYVVRANDVRMSGRSYRILSLSDTHSTMMDPFVWLSFLCAVKELQPDAVLLNGDTLDLVSLSRHPKIPGYVPELQLELDFKKEMFRQLREVHSGAIFDCAGNHDIAVRLSSHLTQVDPALASLRCLRVDELLGLDEFDVQLFHGGTMMSPAGTEDEKDGLLLFGFYRIHHGTKLGQTPSLAELRAAGRSGQSGHVHRAALSYGTTERDEGLCWMSTPMGARHEVGRHYVRGVTAGWQRGFGYAELFPEGQVHQYPVVVHGERITCEGFSWERPKDLLDPDPMTNWLLKKEYQLR